MDNPPIIIIGAARSGTNMLRDAICMLKGLETWPCDEINYVWRHGNIAKEDDRFTSKEVSFNARKYISGEFDRLQKISGAKIVVEKTCANSLRVPFIDSIFSDAKYIFIVRNGYDVTSSALLRWTANFDLQYTLRKLRFVPVSDVPYYFIKFLRNRFTKLLSKDNRLGQWGPIYPGMREHLKNRTLEELCALQWAECVKIAHDDLQLLSNEKVHFVAYDSFVSSPMEEMKKLVKFMGIECTENNIKESIKNISSTSKGNYRQHLNELQLEVISRIVDPVMEVINKKFS